MKSLIGIQYLRGLAALYVVFAHSRNFYHGEQNGGFFEIFINGFSGVYLFFVISGFVITYSTPKTNGWKPFLFYIKKRFIRIYPVYWAVFLPLLGLYFLIPTLGLGYEREFSIILKNFFLIHMYEEGILGVSWTMVFEVLFYTLFSLIVLTNRKFLIPLLIFWIIFVTTRPYFFFTSPFLPNILAHGACFEFILGCWIALLFEKNSFKIPSYLPWFFLAYFCLSPFLFEAPQILPHFLIPHYRILTYSLPAALVVFSFVFSEKTSGIFHNKILMLFGDASYSIYLIHLPLIGVFSGFISFFPFLILFRDFYILLIVICIIVICIKFHQWIEKPLILAFNKLFT